LLQDVIEKDIDIAMGFLTVTFAGKHKLQNRDKFVNIVYNKLVNKYGQIYADTLMTGLI
jgi:hypothetical protein